MSGWSYIPDVERWPAKVAQYLTIAREMLTEGTVLRSGDFVMRLLHEEGIEGDPSQAWSSLSDARLRVPEVELLALEAINRMVADGEAFGFGVQPGGQHYFDMAEALGWDAVRSMEPSGPTSVRPTVRLMELRSAHWLPLETWTGVDVLVGEAREAYARALYVAAAATARVAAEQAVLEGLRTLHLIEDGPAHARETRLFEGLAPRFFSGEELDHSATRAALSAVRSLGNDAAHSGEVPNAVLQESLLGLLPQALVSLFRAVGAALSDGT